jgi:hypothetical protein
MTNVSMTQGAVGNSGSFNGASSKVDFTNAVIPTGPKTVILKYYTPTPNNNMTLLSNSGTSSAASGRGMVFNIINSIIRVLLFNGDLIHLATNTLTDRWHSTCFRWDGAIGTNNISVNHDGALSRISSTVNDVSPSGVLRMGVLVDAAPYGGVIDQIRIYDRVLTDDEVAVLEGFI